MPLLEPHLWPTQYEFRPGRSTPDAIHNVHKMQDHLECSESRDCCACWIGSRRSAS